jgi:hypothetical protein
MFLEMFSCGFIDSAARYGKQRSLWESIARFKGLIKVLLKRQGVWDFTLCQLVNTGVLKGLSAFIFRTSIMM